MLDEKYFLKNTKSEGIFEQTHFFNIQGIENKLKLTPYLATSDIAKILGTIFICLQEGFKLNTDFASKLHLLYFDLINPVSTHLSHSLFFSPQSWVFSFWTPSSAWW